MSNVKKSKIQKLPPLKLSLPSQNINDFNIEIKMDVASAKISNDKSLVLDNNSPYLNGNISQVYVKPGTSSKSVPKSQPKTGLIKLETNFDFNSENPLIAADIDSSYQDSNFNIFPDNVSSFILDNCSSTQQDCRILPDILSQLTLDSEDASPSDSKWLKSENLQDEDSKTNMRKKKKKRKSSITICTANCRYEAVKKVTAAFGMKEVQESEAWNFYWTDLSISIERVKEMKRFQRINHFPGMLEICRKDLLARNLNRMQKSFPRDYCFFPKTWCLPTDFNEALNYSKTHKNKTYIIKPECGSQGRGIYLTRNLSNVRTSERMICQLYVAKPYLVDGYKFDMRIYTLISSCDPLRIFVYNEGLVRFATSRYADPNSHNTTNVFMHLTNYAVNKHSRTYVYDDESGSKRKISTVNRHLESLGVDIKKLWQNIDQVIVKTIIAAWPVLRHSYHACFPAHDTMHACFEVLGFDILLDHTLQPFILEVNHSPSFHTDSPLDKEVKEQLLSDTLTLLNIWQCDKKKIMEEDRRRVQSRLLHRNQRVQNDVLSKDDEDKDMVREKDKNSLEMQLQWEEDHLGNYRRVYPSQQYYDYSKFFEQPSSSLYLSTTSSRIRDDCVRQQRDDIEQARIRAENIKKLTAGRNSKDNTDSESLNSVGYKPKDLVNVQDVKTNKSLKTLVKKDKAKVPRNSLAGQCQIKPKQSNYSSFEPTPIVDSEERERLSQLARRDFLIRSYGLIEQIYLAMKQMGTLRPNDEIKYGMYARNTYGKKIDIPIEGSNLNNQLSYNLSNPNPSIPSINNPRKFSTGPSKCSTEEKNNKKEEQQEPIAQKILKSSQYFWEESSYKPGSGKKVPQAHLEYCNTGSSKTEMGHVFCSVVKMHSLDVRKSEQDESHNN